MNVNFAKFTGPLLLYRQSMVAGMKPFVAISLVNLMPLRSVSHPSRSLAAVAVHPARHKLNSISPVTKAIPMGGS